MYLSRVEMNPYRRETIRAISSPQIIHAAVMNSFSPFDGADDDRILWRVDRIGPAVYILVQSHRRPDFHHMVEQFGRPESGTGWETLDYDSFLSRISDGDVMGFRLRANPTHSVMSMGNGNRGKVVAHVTAEQQMRWLMDKSSGLGFEVTDENGTPSFDIVSRDNLRFRRNDRSVTLNTTTFEGRLKVTDADRFRLTLANGIGRAKAYGCGLMTVIR